MVFKQIKQQVRLATAPDTGHHLDKPIVLFIDKLIQMHVSVNFHIMFVLSTENFCELTHFYLIASD